MTSIVLRLVRCIRTFDLKHSCRTRPYAWYGSLCFIFISWANYAQYKRLRPLYPNYEEYRVKEGARMLEAKQQEMADVMRYNNMEGCVSGYMPLSSFLVNFTGGTCMRVSDKALTSVVGEQESSDCISFPSIVDSEMHRVNLLYLLNGYHVKYSLAVAATLLLLVLTFLFPTERTTHGSVLSLATESFTLLMVAGALFRATGGVFTRRQHQEEWLLGNVKDVIHALLEKGSSPKLCLMLLLGLEIIAEFGKVLQGATCLFVLLLLWIGWLLLR